MRIAKVLFSVSAAAWLLLLLLEVLEWRVFTTIAQDVPLGFALRLASPAWLGILTLLICAIFAAGFLRRARWGAAAAALAVSLLLAPAAWVVAKWTIMPDVTLSTGLETPEPPPPADH